MARPTPELITALRTSVERLRAGALYEWGHMGSCNCGHLVQSLTDLSRAEIHQRAMRRAGDWKEQSVDYCPTSGYPLDDIITLMLNVGMTRADIEHLEWLNDERVLRRIPTPRRWKLRRNDRDDVMLYMSAWADLLEEALPAPVVESLAEASDGMQHAA